MSPLSAADVERVAEALHTESVRIDPGHAAWVRCDRSGPCREDATALAPTLAALKGEWEAAAALRVRREDWSSVWDGRRWAIPSQRTLLTQVVDHILRDVFQGKRDELRDHMLGVAAKVGRGKAYWAVEEITERAEARVVGAVRALCGANALFADFGEPPEERVVAGVIEADLLAALAPFASRGQADDGGA